MDNFEEDYLEAEACVGWTIANLQGFNARLESYAFQSIGIGFKDPDPNAQNLILVMFEKDPLPTFFNVEAGAFINVLRTALDILAVRLANRYNVPGADKIYFPIVSDLVVWKDGGYRGNKLVKGLPEAPRLAIEALQPCNGGDKALAVLHDLDIQRKHKRLLSIRTEPRHVQIIGESLERYFVPVSGGAISGIDGETILGIYPRDAPKPDLKVTAVVAFDEARLPAVPIARVLSEFAKAVQNVVVRLKAA